MAEIDEMAVLTGANAGFIAELYLRFLADPDSVDESWRELFAAIGDDLPTLRAELRQPDWSAPSPLPTGNGAAAAPMDGTALRRAANDSICALNLIRAYRVRGHLEADLDPLGLDPTPSSTIAATVSPRPISTARSFSATCSGENAPVCAKEMPMPDNHLQKQVEQDRPVREGTVWKLLRLAARRAEQI